MLTRDSIIRRAAIAWSLCLILGPGSLYAADDDPPDRVARVSYLQGDVALRPAGIEDWAPTTLNRPLTTDDVLSLDRNARAELQIGSATIHLDEGTVFSFSELSDDVLQARVTEGAIHVAARRLRHDELVEINTPQAAITITKPGDYRIEVLNDGSHTLVKNHSGECQVVGNRETVRLQEREQITLDQDGQVIAATEAFSRRDEFDAWAQGRNERFTRSASARYVAPDVIGYEDLDAHGDWASEPEYGHVWYPRTAVGWSPYRHGHWAWISPWGWTWIDEAPWGFAPFHYGRWAHVHGRWGWVPGPVHVRAVYAPALVAWVGGPHLNLSMSFGSHVGWFPLAPREVYVPGYHCSRRHIYNVNHSNTIIVNNTIINRAYVNRGTPMQYRHRSFNGAVTVVSRDAFVNARQVSRHTVQNRDVREWRTHNASPAIAPDRASTLGPRWNARDSRVPERWQRSANREVISRRATPARATFEQEQRAIRENNNRPVARGDLRGGTRGIARDDAARGRAPRINGSETQRLDTPTARRQHSEPQADRPRGHLNRSEQHRADPRRVEQQRNMQTARETPLERSRADREPRRIETPQRDRPTASPTPPRSERQSDQGRDRAERLQGSGSQTMRPDARQVAPMQNRSDLNRERAVDRPSFGERSQSIQRAERATAQPPTERYQTPRREQRPELRPRQDGGGREAQVRREHRRERER